MIKVVYPNKQVNVALGGGGAKGLAHVGVLQELAEQKYEIMSIVGTSIGALIGAIFAYNRSIRYRKKAMGVRPTQLTACAFLTKCSNHALHLMNG